MKKILFLMMAALLFAGCSKEENKQEEVINISLSKEDVGISVDNEVNIEVSGIDVNDCKVYSEDEFIASVISYNGKINIEAEHVGETNIIVAYKDIEKVCKVKVTPVIDFVGSTVTEFGIKENELKEKVEKPYDKYWTSTQTKGVNVSYTRSGYKITNTYYFDETGLCGVQKKIIATDSDTEVSLNVSKSMMERLDYISTYSSTVNAYPKGHRNSYIFSYPEKHYAVYAQTKYEILYETGTRPATTNYIYFAKDLETAKNHEFTW